MDLSGYAPPIQQLLGMFQTQPMFPGGLSPLHPAFYHQTAAAIQQPLSQAISSADSPNVTTHLSHEAAQILQQRLLATMCGLQPSSISSNAAMLGSVFSFPSRATPGLNHTGNFSIDAILGNKENQRATNVANASVDNIRQHAAPMDNTPEDDDFNADPENVLRYPSGRSHSSGSDETDTYSHRLFPQERAYSVIGKDAFEERRRRFFTEKRHHQQRGQHMTKPYDNTGNFTMNSFQDQRSVGKNKRVRTIFTPEQLERLEAVFQKQQYMVGTERYYLAASLNLSEAQVKVWFQNRRIKWRKHQFEEQHELLQSQQMSLLDDDSEDEARDSHPSHDGGHLCLKTGSVDVETSQLVSETDVECGFGDGVSGEISDTEVVDIQGNYDGLTAAPSLLCVSPSGQLHKCSDNQSQTKEELSQSNKDEKYKPCSPVNQSNDCSRNSPADLPGRGDDNNYSMVNNCNALPKMDYIYTADSGTVIDFTMASKPVW